MMERSEKIRFALFVLAIIAVIGLLAAVFLPRFMDTFVQVNDTKTLQEASNAFALVLRDQKDEALADGTVVTLGDSTFVCLGNRLKAAQDTPDSSAAITVASVGESGVSVYLLTGDGEEEAHKASGSIVYERLIDPDDDTVETYTYSQVNQAAQAFLDEVSYEGADDTVSKIAAYTDAAKRYDRPEGCTVELEAGELTVFDNGTKQAYTVSVQKGPYTFYNITPGVGGEFYVRNESGIVQKGHLRPTGTLRMIHSDTYGLQNMRDLGGWPCDGGTIKYNLLIRGGTVINAADTDRNTWVKLLGIKHDLFVKTYADSELEGREQYRKQSPLGESVSLYQQDLSAEGSENKRNFSMAKEQMNGIMNRLFDNAIAGETTYFHCLAGADRTGMVAIVTEGVLGVSLSDIDRDYELTSFNCLRERNGDGYRADINILKSYPGVNFRDKCIAYLLDCGLTLEKINAFRDAVIDGEPEPIVEKKLDEEPAGMNLCVPDGEGWLDGGRCAKDGEERTDAGSHVLTNFFAVQNGDTVYVKNLHVSDSLGSGLYKTNKLALSGFVLSAQEGAGFVKDIQLTDEWEVFTVDHEEAGYLRLCGILKAAKEDVVICISRGGQWLTEAAADGGNTNS
ncbi:MAG: tyrosine-protein phosphatase [Ruminococcaceae bacterium]|nr:tyrosine-protein phosphatase [Oscillospiraceae bacterium]